MSPSYLTPSLWLGFCSKSFMFDTVAAENHGVSNCDFCCRNKKKSCFWFPCCMGMTFTFCVIIKILIKKWSILTFATPLQREGQKIDQKIMNCFNADLFFFYKSELLAAEVFQKSTFTYKTSARIKIFLASHAAWESKNQNHLQNPSEDHNFVIFATRPWREQHVHKNSCPARPWLWHGFQLLPTFPI